MTNPAMTVALKLKQIGTVWLEIAENALPGEHAPGATKAELADHYGPLLHAIAIDKIAREEDQINDRYLVTAGDF